MYVYKLKLLKEMSEETTPTNQESVTTQNEDEVRLVDHVIVT